MGGPWRSFDLLNLAPASGGDQANWDGRRSEPAGTGSGRRHLRRCRAPSRRRVSVGAGWNAVSVERIGREHRDSGRNVQARPRRHSRKHLLANRAYFPIGHTLKTSLRTSGRKVLHEARVSRPQVGSPDKPAMDRCDMSAVTGATVFTVTAPIVVTLAGGAAVNLGAVFGAQVT